MVLKEKILICDDHPVCCVGLKSSIAQIPTQIEREFYFAHKGSDAIELATTHYFDWVFIDLKLPDLPGIEVIKKIPPKNIKNKIIIFTSSKDFATILKLNEALDQLPIGAVLQKNYSLENLSNLFDYCTQNSAPYIDQEFQILLRDIRKISLTKREYEVLELITQGMTSKEIAQNLNCSAETVKTHRSNILHKTNVKNVAELSTWYIERYGKAHQRPFSTD